MIQLVRFEIKKKKNKPIGEGWKNFGNKIKGGDRSPDSFTNNSLKAAILLKKNIKKKHFFKPKLRNKSL